MRYHIIHKLRTAAIVAALLLVGVLGMYAQAPAAPNPPRLVNDFAKIFTPEETQILEDSLVAFSKKTSNQVTIVTMDDLNGMEPVQMAYEIGDKWGVGGKKFNNGVVILIKPKNATRGQAFIATGYGVEGALPDAICKRIVDNEMISSFKRNDYYGGVESALKVVKPILAKEYSYQEYEKDSEAPWWLGLLAIAFPIIFIVVMAKANHHNGGGRGNSGTMGGGGFFIGGLPFGGGSSSGSGGGFGGGGFGGFGGGGFGGGGAGGSW